MLKEVLNLNLPTCLCTIYNGNFEDPDLQDAVDTILPVINDVIRDAAIRNDLPLIELGRVCDESSDFANPIEPAAHGGRKIAAKIKKVVETHDFRSSRKEIFTGDLNKVPG